jgi:hypothetical protein
VDLLIPNLKDSEGLLQFVFPKGRKDVGRNLGTSTVKSLDIGGKETHNDEDISLLDQGNGGESNLSEGKVDIWEKGAIIGREPYWREFGGSGFGDCPTKWPRNRCT